MDPQSNVPPQVSPPQPPQLPQAPQAPVSAPIMPPLPSQQPQTTETTETTEPIEAPEPQDDGVVSQIVTAITNSKNVLVTVGTDPSVDELASLLGLTALLGKLSKHATAVFSGKVPAAMEFLDPEKTFEDTVDSLRDFIIALDKEKADKLRYKVEDDVVKIFITPYKTVIGQKDLTFSQGDFNVDVVVALGVQKRESFDKAITAHGRILHDATVVAINSGSAKSNIGALDWNDNQASSICEMLVNLSDQLGSDLLDKQISTAFLTGIVAETNRFSNEKTSPKVMTTAAQLMAAGANQQLIATNLRQEGMLSESVRSKSKSSDHDDDGEMVLEHESEQEPDLKKEDVPEEATAPSSKEQETTTVPDKEPEVVATIESAPEESSQPSKATIDVQEEPQQEQASQTSGPKTEATDQPEDQIEAEHRPKVVQPLAPEGSEPQVPVTSEAEAPSAPQEPSLPTITPPTSRNAMTPPQFGGTLNATQLGNDENGSSGSQVEPHMTLEHQNDGNIGSEEAIEAARKAVQDAAIDPPHKRLESIGSVPLPGGEDQPIIGGGESTSDVESQSAGASSESMPLLPSTPQLPPEPSPVDAFMQPHTSAPSNEPTSTSGFTNPQPFSPSSEPSAMPASEPMSPTQPASFPPLPPMPAQSSNGAMPPLPPMPGQAMDPTASFQPQTSPEFMQNMPQSQNSWTQAGDQVAKQQAQADADRQAKIDDKVADYEKTVDRQRELNGLPPLNNPNGSGFPPLPPAR